MEKIINNNPNGYNELRNIITNTKDYIYKRDFFSFGLKVAHKITGRGYHPFWKGLYYNPIDSLTPCHFFNTINLGANPWKVYFETLLPRLGNAPKFVYDYAVKKLASDNCIEIIAISKCAYDLQLKHLEQNYSQYLEAIKKKMIIKLPPQEALINDYEEKLLDKDQIVFTIVGADFFRKGGLETLRAFEMLIPVHSELFLNVVSAMNFGDYATHTDESHLELAQNIMNKFPNNIKHYQHLKNEEVLELFKKTHVGLLPTWADSFGYSVLEAQACGCPVITTDIRAMPEVNNNDVGWIIEVPKNKNNDAELSTILARSEFSAILERELKDIIEGIIKNKEIIKIKGEDALQNIIINHEKDS